MIKGGAWENSEFRTHNSELSTFHFIYEKKFGFL